MLELMEKIFLLSGEIALLGGDGKLVALKEWVFFL